MIQIVVKLLESLALFHSIGYTHCDMKLENVLYEEDSGCVRLIDFGDSYNE